MMSLIKNIIEKGTVEDEKGNVFPLHSHTSISQCEFIQKMMERCDASCCVEIGLAYGISSLSICESLVKKSAPRFISIDPLQSDWQDIGLLNLKKGGYDTFTEFHRDTSQNVLPRLLGSGLKIDFAYVDTSKVFDVVLLDAVYLTRLLKIGGIVAFDDCAWPGVKRMARCIAKWPHLRIAGRHDEFNIGLKRRLLSKLANMLPHHRKIFRDELLSSDEDCGISANCVAFEKIGEDNRNWDWYSDF